LCQQNAFTDIGNIQMISATFQIRPKNESFAIRKNSKFQLKNFEIKKLLWMRSNAMRRDKSGACVQFQLTESIFDLKVNLNYETVYDYMGF